MKILSMCISNALEGGEREVVELSSLGEVKVTYKKDKDRRIKKSVEPALAGSLLEQVYGLKEHFDPAMGRIQPGIFRIVFETDEGEERYMGKQDVFFVEEEEISNVLRESLGLEHVLLLDGDRLWIIQYSLEYHRETDMQYADGYEGHVHLSEMVILDVPNHAVHVSTSVEGTVAARHEVIMADDLFSLYMQEIQDLDLEGISCQEVPQTNDLKMFESHLLYSNGEEVVTQATFDADHLPKDYERFARLVGRMMQCTQVGEDTLFSSLCHRSSKKPDQVLLCVVEMPRGSVREFYSKDDSLQEGDRVLIPVGKDGRKRFGRVVDTMYVDRSHGRRGYVKRALEDED